ncbi:MAG TPA: serine hydrolase [Candidatus Cybelea sp.]
MKRVAFLGGAGAVLIARTVAADSTNVQIAAIARGLSGRIGVYARTLAAGAPLAAYHASEHFPTASVIKLLVMTTAYFEQERHPGTLSQVIVFHDRDLIGGSDFMDQANDGQRFTVAQLLVPMITVSDNTAANLLIKHFGIRTVNAVGARAGMTRTRLARAFLDYTAILHHNDNVSTPADMGRLLYLIEEGAHEGIPTVVSADHCRAMLKIMLGQTDRDAIPAALPPHTRVANKTGSIHGTENDVAVVSPFGEDPLILAIMTKDVDDDAAAYKAIHAVTRTIYASASPPR